jgi:hypothetical protein
MAALFLISRGALLLLAAFLEHNVPISFRDVSFSTDPILRSLTGSDSVYLLGIAAQGYHLEPIKLGFLDWAFFPFYPLVVRVASILTLGNIALAGVLVSNLAFIAAMPLLYELALPRLGHERAIRSLAFVALAPGAVPFAMAYTDSLFLLLAAGAFVAAERGRWPVMAILFGLASLTRPQGILLGIPLAMLIWRAGRTERREAAEGWTSRPWWLRLGWLGTGPLAFLGFSAYLGATVGDPLGMLHAQQAWTDIGNPNATTPSATVPVLDKFDPLVLFLIAIFVSYTFILVFMRRDKVPAAYRVMAFVAILTPLLSLRLNSVARFMAAVWPFSWVLASRRAVWFELAGLAASTGLFLIYAVLNFTQTLAP